jgi:hypothetical protein
MDKFLKLPVNELLRVEKERLSYLFVEKDWIEQGENLDLVAFGEGAAYDDSMGYLKKDFISSEEFIWTSTTSGWTGFCSRDVKPVLFEEAYRVQVRVISRLAASVFNELEEEGDLLFGYACEALKLEIQKRFHQEMLPENQEIIFILTDSSVSK